MKDFIKSDYCTACDGRGFRIEKTSHGLPNELEQCESCEELHQQEIKADRLEDEIKGN